MSKFRSQLDSLVAGNGPERVKLPPRSNKEAAPRSEQPMGQARGQGQKPMGQGYDLGAQDQNRAELAQIKSTLQTLTSSLGQLAAETRSRAPVQQKAPQIDHEHLIGSIQNNMREQVSTEVDKIRLELEKLQISHRQTADRKKSEQAVIADIQRISQGISELQSRHSNSNDQLGELAGNLQNIRGDIRAIAERPQTNFDPSQISDSIQENYLEIAKRLDGLGNLQTGDRFDALNEKLDTLRSGLSGLAANPTQDNGAMQNIEARLQQLSTTIAGLSDKGNAVSSATEEFLPGYFESLDRRLDEITRAVVAAAPQENSQLDAAKLERIEARLASLSKNLADTNTAKTNALGFAEIPELAKMPKQIESTIARLESSISQMGSTLGGSSRFVQEAIGGQLSELSKKIDVLAKRDFAGGGDNTSNELELKIDALAGALDQVSQTGVVATQNLQHQIKDLAGRIDQIITAGSAPDGNNEQLQTLEGQIKAISAQLDTLGSNTQNQQLESRLGGIEQQIQSSQKMAIESATKAAQQVLAQINTAEFGDAHVSAISNLTTDLQKLSTSSSELKGLSLETFDAVRESLSMILDRVNAIELKMAYKQESSPSKAPLPQSDDVLDVARDYASSLSEATAPVQDSQQWMNEMDGAATHQESHDELQFQQDHSNEMLDASVDFAETKKQDAYFADEGNGALGADEFGSAKEARPSVEAPSLEIQEIPAVSAAEDLGLSDAENPIDRLADEQSSVGSGLELPDESDLPLEPGSGAPKLSQSNGGPDMDALMRKANEREQKSPKEKSKHNPTDFIAAARRAAQAAAEEANEVETTVKDAPVETEKAPKLSGLKQLLSRRRKPIIIAASVVLLVALAVPIASNFLIGGNDISESEIEQSANSQTDVNAQDGQSKLAQVDSTTSQNSNPVANENSSAADVKPVRSIDMQSEGNSSSGQNQTVDEIASIARNLESSGDTNSSTGTISSDSALPGMSMPSDNYGNEPGVPLTMAPMPPKEVGPQALRQAAASGEPSAQFEIGRRYTAGLNGSPNLQEASIWYERAASAGFAPAQYRIGNFYEKGHGVSSDVNMAAKWYKKAADNGNALAMHNLAVINAMGVLEGGANMGEAVTWFKKAAEHGVKDSQVNLGILYAKAMGVDEDLMQAYKWFAIAAKAGDKDASQKRDTVAKAMRPEQLAQARGELELWRPANVKPEANKAPVKPEWFAESETTASLDAAPKMDQATVIRTTQSLLNKMGFEAGPADGKMGSKTSSAISAFQKRAGIQITGKPSAELIKIIEKAS